MEFWAVLYTYIDSTGFMSAEIHGIYDTPFEAESTRKSMINPAQYFVRRVVK